MSCSFIVQAAFQTTIKSSLLGNQNTRHRKDIVNPVFNPKIIESFTPVTQFKINIFKFKDSKYVWYFLGYRMLCKAFNCYMKIKYCVYQYYFV